MDTYNAKLNKNEIYFIPKYDNEKYLEKKLDSKIKEIKLLIKDILS
jgi:hypothetical protein